MCAGVKHFRTSLSCRIKEARYLNRTLVLDMRVCLNQVHNNGKFVYKAIYEHIDLSSFEVPFTPLQGFLEEALAWRRERAAGEAPFGVRVVKRTASTATVALDTVTPLIIRNISYGYSTCKLPGTPSELHEQVVGFHPVWLALAAAMSRYQEPPSSSMSKGLGSAQSCSHWLLPSHGRCKGGYYTLTPASLPVLVFSLPCSQNFPHPPTLFTPTHLPYSAARDALEAPCSRGWVPPRALMPAADASCSCQLLMPAAADASCCHVPVDAGEAGNTLSLHCFSARAKPSPSRQSLPSSPMLSPPPSAARLPGTPFKHDDQGVAFRPELLALAAAMSGCMHTGTPFKHDAQGVAFRPELLALAAAMSGSMNGGDYDAVPMFLPPVNAFPTPFSCQGRPSSTMIKELLHVVAFRPELLALAAAMSWSMNGGDYDAMHMLASPHPMQLHAHIPTSHAAACSHPHIPCSSMLTSPHPMQQHAHIPTSHAATCSHPRISCSNMLTSPHPMQQHAHIPASHAATCSHPRIPCSNMLTSPHPMQQHAHIPASHAATCSHPRIPCSNMLTSPHPMQQHAHIPASHAATCSHPRIPCSNMLTSPHPMQQHAHIPASHAATCSHPRIPCSSMLTSPHPMQQHAHIPASHAATCSHPRIPCSNMLTSPHPMQQHAHIPASHAAACSHPRIPCSNMLTSPHPMQQHAHIPASHAATCSHPRIPCSNMLTSPHPMQQHAHIPASHAATCSHPRIPCSNMLTSPHPMQQHAHIPASHAATCSHPRIPYTRMPTIIFSVLANQPISFPETLFSSPVPHAVQATREAAQVR
ncbi:unnamed protein product [Closterium sp. Naga37s-1]|nr:unnamed protein product [Closterium sp. Naga37s-1]